MKFLHIPKTAGQSVAEAMGSSASYLRHKRVSEVQSNDDIMTVVRNPYDRAVSSYYYLKNLQGDAPIMQDLFQSLNGFWDKIYNAPKSGIEHKHMKPQMWFIGDEDGNVSSQIKVLLRYETLEQQFKQLALQEGFAELPVINASKLRPNTHWQNELSEESITQIGELYADDFEHLNYERIS